MKLQIPIPCHADWDEMSETACGRFCQSCQKTVFDFTQKTPTEIETFFQKHQDEEICGRFYPTQLAYNYQFATPSPIWYPASKIAAIILASAMLTGSSGCFMGKAANPVKNGNIKQIVYEETELELQNNFSLRPETLRKIKGTVKNTSGHAITYTKIVISKLRILVYSEANGTFELVLPPKASGTLNVEISKDGYETQNFALNDSDFVGEHFSLNITLKQKEKPNVKPEVVHPNIPTVGRITPIKRQ